LPATGVDVSKTTEYAVASPPEGVDISKTVVYAVLDTTAIQPIMFVIT
jgi:hypothetical protein